MSDMEKTTEQFARDLAIASGDLPDTPAGPAPGVPTWRLDYLPVAQALTQAGYGRWKVKPLEWAERNDLQWEHYEAASCFGYYNISRHAERYGYYKPGEDVHTLYPADTLEAAKAACEADHVARVMGEMEEAPEGSSAAARAILAERERQKGAEGWTTEHDDHHTGGELAAAAACYAWCGSLSGEAREAAVQFPLSVRLAWPVILKRLWPWSADWWKPKDRRRDLVRAGALILAEIDRLDRAALTQPPETE